MSKKDIYITAIIIISCIGIVTGFIYYRKATEVIPYVYKLTPEYQQNMNHLTDASFQTPPDFSEVQGGLYGCHIPIIREQDFPWFTKMLQQELRHASGSFLYHSIVVGGINIHDIDEPLLKASKSYSKRISPNVEIVIVAPSTISAETRSILAKKGIKIRLINSQQSENLK